MFERFVPTHPMDEFQIEIVIRIHQFAFIDTRLPISAVPRIKRLLIFTIEERMPILVHFPNVILHVKIGVVIESNPISVILEPSP